MALSARVVFGVSPVDATATPAAFAVPVAVPAVAASAAGDYPTARTAVGPTSGSPASISGFDVNDSDVVSYTDTIINGTIHVYSGGSLTLTRCEVNGGILLHPESFQTTPLVAHFTDCGIFDGLAVTCLNNTGNLYWGGALDADIDITGCYIRVPAVDLPIHTEALYCAGWPSGARFTDTTMVVSEPFATGVTGVTNWYGEDTVFDGCFFGWEASDAIGGDPMAYYAMYNRPLAAGGAPGGNTVQNCTFQSGSGGIVYPSPSSGNEHAVYVNCIDYATGLPVSLPD